MKERDVEAGQKTWPRIKIHGRACTGFATPSGGSGWQLRNRQAARDWQGTGPDEKQNLAGTAG